MRMRGPLLFIGTILMIVALVFIIWGMVEVGQGKKGTWDIWPFYLIHGAVSLVALVLFGVANRGREKPAMVSVEGDEGP
jgi:EamA domain-containing membrane protein RarD